jgi:dTDP-4-amino-4,6-dideoxygalactose transaminase
MTATMTTAIRVPYVNLAAQHRAIKAELLAAVESVLDGGQFILGPVVSEFERRFAALCGVKFAIGVGNGTDALVLALRALDIGPGCEVITVPNSFVATAGAIVMAGAVPVFVDVGDDLNIDPALVEQAITPRSRALLPVHLTGRPCDMTALSAIAAKHGLRLIEDAAQAVMAEHSGRRVGSFGAAGCFSLHPLKTLNACGDGGVITTDDPEVADRLGLLRNIGLRSRDDCAVWSGNSRLDSLQAALLLVKLNYAERWTSARRENARFYREALANIGGVTLPPAEPAGDRAVYHTFVIQAERRDQLKAFLLARGVETSIHYPVPIHLQRAAAELGYPPGSFPNTERQAKSVLSLPIYPELTEAQRALVVESIGEFYGVRWSQERW